MPKASKFSPDEGLTIYDLKDSEAIHYGDQSKGYVGKNLFKNTGLSTTSNNVAFTHNLDDSIGLNNTASATTFYTIGSVASLAGINQNVILSGCPTGGDVNNGYSMGIRTTSNKNVRHENIDIVDTGNGFRFNPSNPLKDSDGNSVSISDLVLVMRIGNGVNVSDKTFYPMIRLSSISDSTYEPYLTPNTDLMSYADNTALGAKNLLLCTTGGSSIFTIDSEGIATANGGSTSRVWFMYSNGGLFLPKGRYIVNGLPSQGSNSTFNFFIRKHGQDHGQDIYTNETIFNVTEDTTYDLFISLFANYTASNLVFKPMVRRISDTDSTFAPYAMTNKKLTEILTTTNYTSALLALAKTQSAYTVSDLMCNKTANIVELYFKVTDLTQDSPPDGQSFTTLFDFPSDIKPIQLMRIAFPSTNTGNTVELQVDTNSILLRGGTIDKKYDIHLLYISQ